MNRDSGKNNCSVMYKVRIIFSMRRCYAPLHNEGNNYAPSFRRRIIQSRSYLPSIMGFYAVCIQYTRSAMQSSKPVKIYT